MLQVMPIINVVAPVWGCDKAASMPNDLTLMPAPIEKPDRMFLAYVLMSVRVL